jgi:hypothetical protein
MRKVREGLMYLFKTITNPMMSEFQPREGNRDDWMVFEGAYEEAMHVLRLHIVKTLKRNPTTLYGERRINSAVQKARAKQNEKLFTQQELQRRLVRVKSMLEQIDKAQEDSVPDRRRQIKIVGSSISLSI